MMDVSRVLKWIVGVALGAALAASHVSAFAQSDSWKGMDPFEAMDPRFERKSTLKIIKSNGDLDDTLNDQGSAVGFGTSAATGNLEPRVKPGSTESLEIMKKGQLSADKE
ncbi:MAG: hypothetical protein P8R42_29615 [Candidatus Binatia bacterium]|nr:hypothetical protein [Candidatus Binatia bacterium]